VKILLPPTIVRELLGPTKFFKAVKAAAGEADIRQQTRDQRRKAERPPKCLNPHLAGQYRAGGKTCNVPCQAFKIADYAYQNFTEKMKTKWRHVITRKKISTYDAYMACAIPHLIRGLWAPISPPTWAGWKFKKLCPPTAAEYYATPWLCRTIPPDAAQTYGLHYATLYLSDPWEIPIWPGGWECKSSVYVESYLQASDLPWMGFYRYMIYDSEGHPCRAHWTLWRYTSLVYNSYVSSSTPPARAAIQYCPPVIDASQHVVMPPTPWEEKLVNVRHLRNGQTYRMWPQWHPSKPGDYKRRPDPWPPDW